MTIVLFMGLCNFLLYNARIGYENTYDMRGNQDKSLVCILLKTTVDILPPL